VTDDAGLMLAEFLMRGAICVDVCEVNRHSFINMISDSVILFIVLVGFRGPDFFTLHRASRAFLTYLIVGQTMVLLNYVIVIKRKKTLCSLHGA